MHIIYDDNRHLRSFLQRHSQSELAIHQDISERLPQLIMENSPKIKLAKPLRFNGHKIYEYKIVADKQLTCRVAYIVIDDTITIIFISDILIKRLFCQLLASTELIE